MILSGISHKAWILIYDYGSLLSNKACIYNLETFKAFDKCLTPLALDFFQCLYSLKYWQWNSYNGKRNKSNVHLNVEIEDE